MRHQQQVMCNVSLSLRILDQVLRMTETADPIVVQILGVPNRRCQIGATQISFNGQCGQPGRSRPKILVGNDRSQGVADVARCRNRGEEISKRTGKIWDAASMKSRSNVRWPGIEVALSTRLSVALERSGRSPVSLRGHKRPLARCHINRVA
jgi:hypothetical protein